MYLKNNITGLQHIGLPVTNLQRSKLFYEQLGFHSVMHKTIPVARVEMMQLGNFILELYELTEPQRSAIAQRQDGHIDHIALNVQDCQAAFQELRGAGFATLEDEPIFLPFWEHGIRYFYILGPDGERIEFCEVLAR
ncbi:MAG: VOC family protein [Phototrophicaceae bacterium]